MTPVPHATLVGWWAIALGLTVAVVIVVAALLELIVRATDRIQGVVRDIWFGGTRIAQNTVTIALVRRTNDLAHELLASAERIDGAAARIRHAAQGGGR